MSNNNIKVNTLTNYEETAWGNGNEVRLQAKENTDGTFRVTGQKNLVLPPSQNPLWR